MSLNTQVNAEIMDVAVIWLITISHSQLVTPLRLAVSYVNVVSRGNTFLCYPGMSVAFPDDELDKPPAARIRMEDVDKAILTSLRGLDPTDSVYITIEIVLSDDLNVSQLPPFTGRITSVNYDSNSIEGDIRTDDLLGVGGPALSYTPAIAPAIYAGTI